MIIILQPNINETYGRQTTEKAEEEKRAPTTLQSPQLLSSPFELLCSSYRLLQRLISENTKRKELNQRRDTMGEEDQVRPFALASPRISMDEENASAEAKKRLRRRRCIRCCGCSMVTLLIVIIVFIILIFTVFKVKDPTITMKSVQFDNVSVSDPGTPSFNLTNPSSQTTSPSVNVTMTSDMAIYNPNIASFKFNSTSTNLYYYGSLIGDAVNPAGNAGARSTFNMNMTVQIFIDPATTSTQEIKNLTSDLSAGSMTMTSYTNMNGRVNVLNIFKKNINVKMNCSMVVTISTTTMNLEDMACKSKVTM